MGIRFIFDEGIGQNVSEGLKLFGYNVEHVLDNFEMGTKDEEWLKYAGENNLVLILKDKYIRKRPNEKVLILKYNLVAFYLGGSESSGHNILGQLVNAWNKMEQCANKQQKKGVAGAFMVRPGGGKIIDIPLT
ncbi:MAG: DUF5615 family PIN-like protein [Anaerolineales bacterium]|nr:DUF5615 family PIN-like protein [Anaerolineales bacterium]